MDTAPCDGVTQRHGAVTLTVVVAVCNVCWCSLLGFDTGLRLAQVLYFHSSRRLNGRSNQDSLLFFVARRSRHLHPVVDINQQSRFQMSFLPPAPHARRQLRNYPNLLPFQPNLYLGADIPAIILANPQLPSAAPRATPLIRTPQRRFQRGKRALPGQRSSPTPAGNSTPPSI